MATVLADRSINDIDRFFETHGTQNVTFLSQNQEAIRLWIKDLQTQSSMSSQDLKTLGWISRMLQYPVDERPTAAQLRGNIIDDSSEHLYICSKCMTPDGIKGTDTVKAVSQQLAPVTASSLGLSERPPTKPPKTEASDVEGETARRRDGGEPHRQVTALQTIRRINSHDQDFIQPSPVKPPPYLRKDSIPLPTATMVPSYIRAGMNHPSKEMLDEAQTYNPQGSNLFVYGRLMFPAMLHALAAASVKGVYAPQLRRRLYPSTADWSHADISIKNACDAMVPARLTGYDRWRPKGLNCAVIKDSRFTPRIMEHIRDRKGDTHTISPSPTGEVDGFLILGVRSDALRYCDLLFSTSEQTLWSMTPPADDDSDSESSHAQRYIPCLRRRQVKVSLEQADGTIRSVSAETYVWTESVSSLQSTWSEDRFVRSTVMQNVLSTVPSWTYEENQLALEMHITLALVGDYLCAAISAGNIAALSGLLNDNFDANAPCRLYGFPLHAAIVADKDDMVRLLIAHGADLEAPSKRYGTPLITAVVHNRIGIAKLLMHHGAKVLASDERHVNALYQAVKHGNYALTETLLEHGAWLSLNWREIMDLAEDGGSGDMVRLLKIYDVKGRARDKRERSRSSRDERLEWRSEYSDSWETVPYSDVGMAVLRRLGTVSQMPYNWKGRRAVELTIAALEAGAPMRLLGLIREAIHPIKAILDMLRRSDEHHGQDIVVPRRAIALERDREPSPRGRVPEIIQTEDGARSLEMAARNLRIRPSRPPPYFRGARSDVDVEENRTIGRERERDRHRGRDGDYSRERDHGRERDHEHRRYGDHLTVPGQEEQGIRRAVSIDERTLGERRRRPDRRRSETRDGRRESLV
ncbi:hypothetical protein QBC47DRAFT_385359 [Echria macrotheca]|uniref:Ankyrin repeat protein n=1 Tax=Echria macrotheca TaxID=438768 RepID=A0AAJ0BAZ0_9PEZI|nr:hypothetical protein QBC47DRAFT_385359 [Echria macrotheca]